MVMLCTADMVSDPNVLGMMSIANGSKVRSMVVTLPDFHHPSEAAIDRFEKRVPSVFSLSKFSISLEMIKESFSWLKGCPSCSLAAQDIASLDYTVNSILSFYRNEDPSLRPRPITVTGSEGGTAAVQRRGAAGGSTNVAICVDHDNIEAVCVAHIVVTMVTECLLHTPELRPFVLDPNEAIPANVHMLMVICSNGCLSQPTFLETLSAAHETKLKRFLIFSEESFRHPDKTQLDAVKQVYKHHLTEKRSPNPAARARCTAEAVRSTFRDFGMSFNPHADDATLESLRRKAELIAAHLVEDNVARYGLALDNEVDVAPILKRAGTQSDGLGTGSASIELRDPDQLSDVPEEAIQIFKPGKRSISTTSLPSTNDKVSTADS